jgi:H+/Cl- antiporter ClcA
MGNYAYFGHTSATLPLETGWMAVLVCGVCGGLIGGLFSRTLVAASRGLPGKFGVFAKTRPVAFAALCGLALAAIGVASGNLAYGTGYPEARLIVEESGHLPAWYGLAKLLATVASYFSGTPGGIFAPSLAIGAGLGQNAASILPSVPIGAVVLLGMVGYFSGVVQAPITAFVIVMEMTDNHGMILPLMATAFLANAVSRLVCHKSLYKALAEGFLARIQAASGPR